MHQSIVALTFLVVVGLCQAQVPSLPSSFTEKEIRAGAQAFQKVSSAKSRTSAEETVKAAEFVGYVGGHIDAKTDGPNPDPTFAECLQSKSRSVVVRRTASLLAEPNTKSSGSVRFDVGLAALMACKDEYWGSKSAEASTAQWAKFGENARLTAFFQKDMSATVGLPTVWVLYDYKAEQQSERSGRKYYSEKARQEVDCVQARSRTTFFTWHKSNLGDGPIVYTGRTSLPWEPHAPGSIGAALAAVICKPK